MKSKLKLDNIENVVTLALLLLAFASCEKNAAVGPLASASSTYATQTAIANAKAIAVSASRTGTGDSIYVVNTCERNHHADSIAFSTLPASVGSYLSTNYAGYTFQKAFSDKDSSGNIAGYIVIIQYNGKPVGLKFNAAGAFVEVLEQREGHDLNGHGWHEGGCFDDRDGMMHDTVAISALPTAVTSYFSSNYSQDTLVHAFKNKDGSYVVLSTNNGAFATVFSSAGTFIQRIQLPTRDGRVTSIAQAALPAASANYLSTTYPNYVFKAAFTATKGGVLQGYVVFIDANATKYAVEFDASGNFVRAVTVR